MKESYAEGFDYLKGILRTTWLWTTVGLVGLMLVGGILLYFLKRERLKGYLKGCLVGATAYGILLGASGFACALAEMESLPTWYYALIATVVVAILAGMTWVILCLVGAPRRQLAGSILLGAVALPLLTTIGMTVLVDSGPEMSNIGLVAGVFILAAVGIAVAWFGRPTPKSEETKSLVYAGVSVALAFALSYVRLWRMPQGGSITMASMLPIMLYSYRYGTRKGLLAGLVYGLLQAMQSPDNVFHPAQFVLDYPVAFCLLGVCGWSREHLKLKPLYSMTVGMVSAIILRYAAHVLSGIFAFGSWAMEGYGAVAWGFLYNTFVLVDGAICIVAALLMFGNKQVRKLLWGDAAAAETKTFVDTETDHVDSPSDECCDCTDACDKQCVVVEAYEQDDHALNTDESHIEKE